MKLLPTMLLGAMLSLTMSHLALAQADLNSSLAITNVAAGKPASQISTGYGAIASRAVDGNTDGHMDHGSVTHTDNAIGAWWEVDLLQATTIQRISVFNRTDCCNDRLSNFTVQILDGDRAVIKEFITSSVAPNVVHFTAAASRGRYVRIQLNGDNALSLAEVQVWAES
ncbi:discoidin domain-containing protein [Massilia sp. CCM 8734]|uniref:galactose-binding domain-containing protein n=1 Tax=Massilia sp. CCM 8734 TaxID=2609283 RepID=UPI001423DFBB|nr:discoidin domain-containing protein [Massilia sp. CCM 8734]NHZ95157.1 hypothetical protein [Massilia sp. CCM 8734]